MVFPPLGEIGSVQGHSKSCFVMVDLSLSIHLKTAISHLDERRHHTQYGSLYFLLTHGLPPNEECKTLFPLVPLALAPLYLGPIDL